MSETSPYPPGFEFPRYIPYILHAHTHTLSLSHCIHSLLVWIRRRHRRSNTDSKYGVDSIRYYCLTSTRTCSSVHFDHMIWRWSLRGLRGFRGLAKSSRSRRSSLHASCGKALPCSALISPVCSKLLRPAELSVLMDTL